MQVDIGDLHESTELSTSRTALSSSLAVTNTTTRTKHEKKVLSTDFQALVNIIKANIGSGILGMPFAFKNGGVWLGTVALVIIAIITMHCVVLLVKCKRRLIKNLRRQKMLDGESVHDVANEVNTYGDVGRLTIGRLGTIVIAMLLVFTQCGFCK
jgi:proton-coupled amino acid transporter